MLRKITTDDALRMMRNVGQASNKKVDAHYTYNQNTASAIWVVEHNLGKIPSVEVVDSAGTVVIGDVQHNSTNKVTITFTAPFSGKAFLN